MAAFDTSRPVAAVGGGTVSSFVSNLFGDLIAWNDARVTRNALSKLTDRELEDVGLTRADLSKMSTIVR